MNINIEQLKKILTVQDKAVKILKSLQNTSDLNFRQTNIKTFKISENILRQIDSVLNEIERINPG